MPLTDTSIRALRPKASRYVVSDTRGLSIEVYPTGGMVWHFRYRLQGKQERITFGKYPDLPLKLARIKRDEYATQVAVGKSPAKEKQLARQSLGEMTTVRDFGERYYKDQVEPALKNPAPIRRYLDVEIYPRLGTKVISAVTASDIQSLVFRKRDEGSLAAAGQIRGVLKRLFEYAFMRGLVQSNPVLSLPMRYVTTHRPRTRALSPDEISIYLVGVYQSDIRRQFKLALHLILLTMVRKSELLLARWSEVDLASGQWSIPTQHSKTGAPHTVYLSEQAKELFRELRHLSAGSDLVLPGRGSLVKPFAHNAINHALKGVHFPIPPFTIHDMRRTASTLLNESGFNSDVIEKALNHTLGGVRGVYNVAEYADQRREMLQVWATYVENLVSGHKLIVGNSAAPEHKHPPQITLAANQVSMKFATR